VLGFALVTPASAAPAPAASNPVVRVVIHVAGNGAPVAGETIYMEKQDGGFYDITSAETNVFGNADISEALAPGTWIVRYMGRYGGVWNPGKTTIVITPGRNLYGVDLPLTRSTSRLSTTPVTPGARGLAIRVQGRNWDGTVVPVHYATIYDTRGNVVVTTGYDGRANIRHDLPLGELYTLTAEALHWQPQKASFTVGAASGGTTLTLINDYVNFMLRPQQSVASLTVEVVDRDTEKPIDAVLVTLYKHKSTSAVVGTMRSDSEGKALFTSVALSQAQLDGVALVGVKVNGYGSQSRDVTLSSENDYMTFDLERSEAASLTVDVLDHDTDKPVKTASITLYKPNKFPGTAVATRVTAADGTGAFDADLFAEALLDGNARVGVKAPGYASAVQNVERTGKEVRTIVYLKRQIKTVPKWTGTFTGPQLVYTLTGSNSDVTAKVTWAGNPGSTGQGGTMESGDCKITGNTAVCNDVRGEYFDSGKRVEWTGSCTLTLSADGDTLTAPCTRKTATETCAGATGEASSAYGAKPFPPNVDCSTNTIKGSSSSDTVQRKR
jgi:5-hydroxyisourate hydrolase-like protein (transthyretin family)